MTTRIACTGISGRILQGRVTADGKSFSGQTKDVTSDVLAAVIDKLKHHGGSFTINCNGEPVATLTLSDPAAQDRGEVRVLRGDILAWRKEWMEIQEQIAEQEPGTDIVTPFDHYLYGGKG